MQKLTYCLLSLLLFIGCTSDKESRLSSFNVFCEMVAGEAKPLALSEPMTSRELDKYWQDFEKIAAKFQVRIYREKDFPVTPLFPPDVTQGKEVVIIYRANRLVQYDQLKADLNKTVPLMAARRLGRLLGYSPQGINGLLMKNSEYRTFNSYGVTDQVTHVYYENIAGANTFYSDIIGLKELDTDLYKISDGAFLKLHSFDDKHPKNQPKSTAIAFLTDQLPEWYTYIKQSGAPIKYTYKPKEDGPHDGFVAIDPGGYLLEFEEFKQHPENELFMAILENTPRVETRVESLNFHGSITWTYHNDLLKMQKFYEEDLGFTMVADQGWTKIYQTTSSAFIGLVDERRGMMDYADNKAVEIEWKLDNRTGAITYFSGQESWQSEEDMMMGPENYRYLIR
ncbi:VOC family protein [Ekhidna sp.]